MNGTGAALGVLALAFLLCSGNDADDPAKVQFEAAFQGQCGHGSPCEQLCYELHDGMYECDCSEGFLLREDGYSCYAINSTASPSEELDSDAERDVLYQKDVVFDAVEFNPVNATAVITDRSPVTADSTDSRTTLGPNLEQKATEAVTPAVRAVTTPITPACALDCGPGAGCVIGRTDGKPKCLCPLGKGGATCQEDVEIRSPRFTGSSWLAFPALRGAYKHVQVSLELRPEAYDGIFFLAGERDDMGGDFMVMLLHQGFVEFRFDCGSGMGIVRSQETVLLNQWNHVSLYRHRWDAWVQLNGGKHVQGRSKGLFSRITFREPLFIGGSGNTTGLTDKLPVTDGFKGCVRHLEVNDHVYRFALDPNGEALKGYGIEECTADRCSRIPCQHGGQCLTNKDTAICLCPLGFSGDLCETRVDLQVPSFNGSSHLRYRGLGDDALTWLDLEVTLKPTSPTGLILYNGHHTSGTGGDFMALYVDHGHVEFAYDLGTGVAVARSKEKITTGEWHSIRVSRTGRLGILVVDGQVPVEVLSPGAFTQLSLPLNLYLGGVPSFGAVSRQITVRNSFIGCVQKVTINGRGLSILAEALGGANVDNCPHPCITRPCGEDGECVPEYDYFTCRCKPGYRDQLCSRGPPAFRGLDSYMHFRDERTLDTLTSDPLDINMRFKVSSADGLLVWLNSRVGNFLTIGLDNGALILRFSVKGEEVVVVHNSSIVHDNLWHRIRAVRDGSSGILIVDNGPTVTRQLVEIPRRTPTQEEGLYIGGMPRDLLHAYSTYRSGIKGCVTDLVLNTDHRLQLINHSSIGRNIGECEV